MNTYNKNMWSLDEYNITSINILVQPEDDFFSHIRSYIREENDKKLESTYIDYFNEEDDENDDTETELDYNSEEDN